MIRYLLVMMGFYAFYNGLIYNEVFAIPVEFWHSCYASDIQPINASDPYSENGFKRLSADCVYTIGVDPRWAQSD